MRLHTEYEQRASYFKLYLFIFQKPYIDYCDMVPKSEYGEAETNAAPVTEERVDDNLQNLITEKVIACEKVYYII